MSNKLSTEGARKLRSPMVRPALAKLPLSRYRTLMGMVTEAHYGSVSLAAKGYKKVKQSIVQLAAERLRGINLKRDMFQNVFMGPDPEQHSIDPGRIYYSEAGNDYWHYDHYFVCDWLENLLALGETKNTVQEISPLELPLEGDYYFIGGPVSTPYTRIAWQYVGLSNRKLKRVDNPILPLRWFTLPDESDTHTGPVAWKLPILGLRMTHNWIIEDVKGETSPVCQLGRKRVKVGEQYARLPEENYVILTRVRNFFDSEALTRCNDKRYLPWLFVFEGIHGVGTRALRLLTTERGKEVLQEIEKKGSGTHEFQILLRAVHLQEGLSGFHSFMDIEYEDYHEMDVSLNEYRKLNEIVMKDERIVRKEWIAPSEQ